MKSSLATFVLLFIFCFWTPSHSKGLKSENIQSENGTTLASDQEEYVNPYTKQVEIGSNQWRGRWINEGGGVIYTDDESYNPNVDINLNRSNFKRTPIRKRFPN